MRSVGELNGAIRQQADRETAVRVFGGVAQDVVENAPERTGVRLPDNLFTRHLNIRDDAVHGQCAVKPRKALLQNVVQADRFRLQRIGRGREGGIAEQLLRQAPHGVRPLPHHSKIALRLLGLRFLLQQIEIAADGGERCAQVVRDVRSGGRQLIAPDLQPQALLTERLRLVVDLRGEGADRPVAGGNGDQRVGVRFQLFIQLPCRLADRMSEYQQIKQQKKRGEAAASPLF